MGVEIERKFLVSGNAWRPDVIESRELKQGYVAIDGSTTVRVRTDGREARVTIKGPSAGWSRPEFEYRVPPEDAAALLDLCRGRLVEKVRHRIPCGGRIWEIDEFTGRNRGLVVAELELSAEEEKFVRPGWLGAEVSADPRYFNAKLSLEPYDSWPEK